MLYLWLLLNFTGKTVKVVMGTNEEHAKQRRVAEREARRSVILVTSVRPQPQTDGCESGNSFGNYIKFLFTLVSCCFSLTTSGTSSIIFHLFLMLHSAYFYYLAE